MADIVGLIASVVTLIDFSIKVGKRLEEYSSTINKDPKIFGAIKDDLPLLILILKTIEEDVKSGLIRPDEQNDLHFAVRSCRDRVQELEACLEKVLPKESDNAGKRFGKACKSFVKEQGIKEIITSIRESIQTLTNYRMVGVVGPLDSCTVCILFKCSLAVS